MLHKLFHKRHGQRFARDDDWMDGSPGQRHGGRHHMFGGGRARRPFDHGDLRIVVLQLIAEKPRYGYDIIKAIEEKVGGSYSPSPGVVYPTLTLLEELGYATVSATDTAKKLYSVTESGTMFLNANQPTVDAISHRLAKLQAMHSGGSTPQILRAKENLKLALRLRLSSGTLDDAKIKIIAQILDDAASKIEQA